MSPSTYNLFCDGGARNNPGPAGAGFALYRGEEEVLAGGAYLGETTNNVAEYCGFIWALENAEAIGAKRIKAFADSSLMAKQLSGEFKVKDAKLKHLHARAQELMAHFDACDIAHVFREDNERADALANEAMDARDTVGIYQVDSTNIRQMVADLNASLFDGGGNPTALGAPTTASAPTSTPTALASALRGVYSLQVKWHFDAAHHLYDYPGECAKLHGHTWEVEATVESEQLNDIGIVYDFKDLKDDLKHILDTYDHKHLNDIPPFDVVSPTAENLARIIYEELVKIVGSKVRVAEVAVWESPVARVGYRVE